jgi:hypothetical protein
MPLAFTSPPRGELELQAFGRSWFETNFDETKGPCLSLPLMMFTNEFGAYRNGYRSLMEVYLLLAEHSHENLVYCFNCHGQNPEIQYNTLSSARSRDVIEIEDAPSRSSISTTNQIAPRFGLYNRQGAETLRQSQPLRHNSIRRGNRR